MPLALDDRQHLRRLRGIVTRARRGPAALSTEELRDLPRLYRHACTALSELETRGGAERARVELAELLGRTHALLHRGLAERRGNRLVRAVAFLLSESPRALRAEWRLGGALFLAFYGLAAAAYFAVSRDLELAYSLFDATQVDIEVEQLRATAPDAPFRGNFTFGLGASAGAASMIMVNNIKVGLLFFTSGLVAPLYAFIATKNFLMLGTYVGVAAHWGKAGSISSFLWCHGVIEIQALIFAGLAGLVLLRGLVAPGPWTRRQALTLELARAWRILAPLFPLLVVAGLIEGFVTPHAPLAARLAVAISSGVLLVTWLALGGRRTAPRPAPLA